MNEIHKQRIKLWIDRLNRSKRQTRGELKNKDGRCCLGVACDVYKDQTKDGEWVRYNHRLCFHDYSGSLPPKVRDWFGFSDGNPRLIYGERSMYASALNDQLKLNFKQIAKCIKKTFLQEEKNETNS